MKQLKYSARNQGLVGQSTSVLSKNSLGNKVYYTDGHLVIREDLITFTELVKIQEQYVDDKAFGKMVTEHINHISASEDTQTITESYIESFETMPKNIKKYLQSLLKEDTVKWHVTESPITHGAGFKVISAFIENELITMCGYRYNG